MTYALATLESLSLARTGTTFHGPRGITLSKNSQGLFHVNNLNVNGVDVSLVSPEQALHCLRHGTIALPK